MQPNQISKSEKNRITDSSAHLFKVKNPDWFPCQANADKLCAHLENQLGFTIEDYPYPITVDMFQVAHDQILQTSWFYQRPEEEEVVDEDALREDAAQQKVRADYAARQRAEQTERDRNMPLSELGKIVSVQNKDFRGQRELGQLPIRKLGLESRHVEHVKLGIAAQARVNVGLANPSLDTHSAEFARKCAVEVSRLRG